jgi:hypothetical protein
VASIFSDEPESSNDGLRAALFEYIEIFYNRESLHSTLGPAFG